MILSVVLGIFTSSHQCIFSYLCQCCSGSQGLKAALVDLREMGFSVLLNTFFFFFDTKCVMGELWVMATASDVGNAFFCRSHKSVLKLCLKIIIFSSDRGKLMPI